MVNHAREEGGKERIEKEEERRKSPRTIEEEAEGEEEANKF